MISISRCPYRISLLGGGSDLGWFLDEQKYGMSLGYSLSKYSYTVVNKLPNSFSRGILNYSSREEYVDIDEIAHPLIRSALKYFSISYPIEMSSFGFASRGSGLGGSSSFLISLLNSLSLISGKILKSNDLAEIASNIEINWLSKPIGKQDQYICSSGGLSSFKYEKDKVTKLELSSIKEEVIKSIIDRLFIIPSNITRSADNVLKGLKNKSNSFSQIKDLREIVEQFLNLEESRQYIIETKFHEAIKNSWEIKKEMSGVMNEKLTEQYNYLSKLPLQWIRLLGAGSGGYFLICPSTSPAKTIEYFENLGINDYIKASISSTGVELIHQNE